MDLLGVKMPALYESGELGESSNGLNTELDDMFGGATAMSKLVVLTFGGTTESEFCSTMRRAWTGHICIASRLLTTRRKQSFTYAATRQRSSSL